jgi:cysteine desulfurase
MFPERPRPVYLDYHATTPVDPRVLEVMLPYFTGRFGNASSRNHAFGWAAAEAVDRAREQVAALVGAHHREVVFTSGATESNNMAIKGVVASAPSSRRHVITVATEHHSVLDTCRFLESLGCEVTRLPVQPSGLIDLGQLEAAVTDRTVLVSIMAANNEIGVLQPVSDIAGLCARRDVVFHTDASQAAGRVPFDLAAVQADLVSFTAHKLYGPKGIGALVVRRRGAGASLPALLHGGGQERGLRPGTLNVPGIVGFGEAARLCRLELADEGRRIGAQRDHLLNGLRERLGDVHVNGTLAQRLPHNLNVGFPGIEPEPLRIGLDDLAVSFGAACSTGTSTPSHVLAALGTPVDLALASVRFGLGRWTTDEEIEFAVDKVARVVDNLRRQKAALAG